jgi:hypothetical protein
MLVHGLAVSPTFSLGDNMPPMRQLSRFDAGAKPRNDYSPALQDDSLTLQKETSM